MMLRNHPLCRLACLLVIVAPFLALLAAASIDAAIPSSPAADAPAAMPEAWWTGPILASSGNTLPRGHALIEPYLFDARGHGHDYAGSLTYFLYGLTDRLTIGLIPTFGSGHSAGSDYDRHVGAGDLTLQAQYRLHLAAPGGLVPTVSFIVQEILPSGRFDRLKGDPDRGIGSGSSTTVLGLYAQRLDLLPNGRPLRTRLNLTYSVAGNAHVHDASVYGTPVGFDGHARPGDGWFADLAAEYSLSRQWVLAGDVFIQRVAPTTVSGTAPGNPDDRSRFPVRRSVGIAPAIEYNWSASRGVIAGVRRIFPGRNAGGSWTPVIAFNAYL